MTINEFFHLQKIHDSAIENEEKIVALITFTAHQKILYKKLMTATCVKNHLKKVHKLKSLKIQKLILKEMMIINDIVREILNVKRFAIHSILIIYHFVNVSNCSDIFLAQFVVFWFSVFTSQYKSNNEEEEEVRDLVLCERCLMKWWLHDVYCVVMIALSCRARLSVFASFSSVCWFTYVIISLKSETIIIQWFFFSNNEFMLESEWLCFSLMFQPHFKSFYKLRDIFHIFAQYSLIIFNKIFFSLYLII